MVDDDILIWGSAKCNRLFSVVAVRLILCKKVAVLIVRKSHRINTLVEQKKFRSPPESTIDRCPEVAYLR